MYGYEGVHAQDISIASGTTYSSIGQILGANAVVLEIATANTTHVYGIQVSNTLTTGAFRNLVAFNQTTGVTFAVGLSSSVGNETVSMGMITGGMKYVRIVSDIALVDGQTITLYNNR